MIKEGIEEKIYSFVYELDKAGRESKEIFDKVVKSAAEFFAQNINLMDKRVSRKNFEERFSYVEIAGPRLVSFAFRDTPYAWDVIKQIIEDKEKENKKLSEELTSFKDEKVVL